MDYQLIHSNQQLADFCRELSGEKFCAVDTEFVREKTYYPLLSLIQIGGEKHLGCIDPFTISDFEPLKQLFRSPDIVKVFHSPSQDLEILFQQFGDVPFPVFDTQLAASVLGYQHQVSYADLVFEITGTRLEKKHTRADWSKRPLSNDELDYAMDDVRYLMPVYRELARQLDDSGRLGWIENDLEAMSRASAYQADDSELWRRLKGVQKLKGVQMKIAQDLCQWREQRAREKNRPRRWIAADDWIIEISRKRPATMEELGSIREIPPKIVESQGSALLSIVEQALRTDPGEWPQEVKPQTLTPDQQALGDCIMGLCRVFAQENNIALATFATRRDIDNLITNRKASRLAQGWRFKMAGESLLEFIHGQSGLAVVEGKLKLSD